MIVGIGKPAILDFPVDNDSSDGAKVVYESKDGKTSKTFDALDWPRGKPGSKHSHS